MKRYTKGDKVKPGFFLDLRRADFIQVDGSSTAIPENANGSYFRVHGIIAAILMALFGLGIVLFLPFAAIVGMIAIVINLIRGRRPRTSTTKSIPKQID
jgi:hypothetical protein